VFSLTLPDHTIGVQAIDDYLAEATMKKLSGKRGYYQMVKKLIEIQQSVYCG